MLQILMLHKFLFWNHRLMRGLIYNQDELESNVANILNFQSWLYNFVVVMLKLNSHLRSVDFVIPYLFNIFIFQKSWLSIFFNKLKLGWLLLEVFRMSMLTFDVYCKVQKRHGNKATKPYNRSINETVSFDTVVVKTTIHEKCVQ